MTDKQPEALRLADLLQNDGNDCTCAAYSLSECGCGANWSELHADEAATELRRLHEVNAELVEALKEVYETPIDEYDLDLWVKVEAAIDKATGEQQ